MKRLTGIDLIKTYAIIGVIMIHVSAEYILNSPVLSSDFSAATVWRTFCAASVPLFLMCSGALLLRPEKELTLKKLYFHNILRLVIAMFVWAMLYKIFALFISHSLDIANLWRVFKDVLTFDQEFHLYYIHVMLLVYAFLPITRVFVKSASEKTMRYALIIWLLLGIVYPTAQYYWPFKLMHSVVPQWALNFCYCSIGYGVAGWYLMEKKLPTKIGCALALFGALAIMLPTLFVSRSSGSAFINCLDANNIGVCALALGLFIMFLNVDIPAGKLNNCVRYVSKASFCIYLVHIFAHRILVQHFGVLELGASVYMVPLVTAVIFGLSLLAYLVLSHIPVVKDWTI